MRELDLASLVSVRRFADRLGADAGPVDVLLNNAAVMAVDRSRTQDGFEMHFGVNHLGHFALAGLLLPVLARSPGARVVNVSSIIHRLGRLDLDDPMYAERRYSRWGAYCQSKLANLLFTAELDRRLSGAGSGVTALSSHPGMARTELGKQGSSTTNWVMRNLTPAVVRSPDAGAASVVRACVDPGARGGDCYGPRWLAGGSPILETPSWRARRPDDARRLWELSERLTGVSYSL